MRSRLPGRLLVVALLGAAMQPLLSVGVAHANTDPVIPAEYCVNNPPTYVLGKEVLPGGKYCVPGP